MRFAAVCGHVNLTPRRVWVTPVLAVLLAGIVFCAAAAAHTGPAVLVISYKAIACPGNPAPTCVLLGGKLPSSFSSSCIKPPPNFFAGGYDHIARHEGKATVTDIWLFSYQALIGSVRIAFNGSWRWLAVEPYNGGGSGTWRASQLPAACGTITNGKVQMRWMRAGNKLVARFEFLGLR